MKLRFITDSDLKAWLRGLASGYGAVYAPRQGESGLELAPVAADGDPAVVLDGVRVRMPLKSFFFPMRGCVGAYLGAAGREAADQRRVIVGVKSCDLKALDALDAVFSQGDFDDPFYSALREATAIVSTDCSSPLETCFCRLAGPNPYPEKGFDINLAVVDGGCVAEVATARGEMLLEKAQELFTEATEAQVAERDTKREQTVREVDRQNEDYRVKGGYTDVVRGRFDTPVWDEEALPCVECAACTQVCPCCYCFLLYDQKAGGGFERIRNWDSCQYRAFARVAGGANPRMTRGERLRHRYAHKFDYFVDSHGMTKCTGCGRCVELCMGKIDMRKVLKRAATETPAKVS